MRTENWTWRIPVTGNQIPHHPSHDGAHLLRRWCRQFDSRANHRQLATNLTALLTPDFNKDGHLDLAVSNRTDGTVSILLGDGTGNFTTLRKSVLRSVLSRAESAARRCEA